MEEVCFVFSPQSKNFCNKVVCGFVASVIDVVGIEMYTDASSISFIYYQFIYNLFDLLLYTIDFLVPPQAPFTTPHLRHFVVHLYR